MVEATPLHYVNGGMPQAPVCSHCGTALEYDRAVAQTPGGVKFFCKMEPGDKVEDSCYLRWKIRRH